MGNTVNNTIGRYEGRYATRNIRSRLCHKCEIPFKEGEMIYRKRIGGKAGKVKSYHIKCWEKTLQ